jgi:hypothetical protein
MTNSDAFAHIHQMRDSRTRQAFDTTARRLTALQADLDSLLKARRVDQLAPGSGLAGGNRGGDIADPTANTALRRDRTVELWAEWDLAQAELNHASLTLTRIQQAVLHEPTPTGLCRDGQCPEGKMADRGKTMRGVARCHACYRFWLQDASNPDERAERERVGQSPRRLGLDKDAVA